MKKYIAAILGIVLMLSMAITSLAATVPGADLRAQADSVELATDIAGAVGDMSALHSQGVRLFDTEKLLSADQAAKIEEILDGVSDETGYDLVIVTTDGYSGLSDSREFCDHVYVKAGLGNGSEKDGSMLMINMVDRDVYIYTYGAAIKAITDNQQNYIYDELDGGLVTKLGNNDIAGACAVYAAGILDGYQNQPVPKKKGLFDYIKNAILAAVVSAFGGFLPVSGVKKKYAMQTEKKQAEGFNLAYRANSKMALRAATGAAAGVGALKLVSRNVTRAPIPVNTNKGSHGGGTSTTHASIGGGVHGGSGRKF